MARSTRMVMRTTHLPPARARPAGRPPSPLSAGLRGDGEALSFASSSNVMPLCHFLEAVVRASV